MARRLRQTLSLIKDVNVLLLGAWEHGARHVALRPSDTGTEVSFLGADGSEHIERWPMPYRDAVQRLRQLSASLGRVRVNVAGQHWHFDAAFPAPPSSHPVFLHLRPDEE
jgi:hypothetical protein